MRLLLPPDHFGDLLGTINLFEFKFIKALLHGNPEEPGEPLGKRMLQLMFLPFYPKYIRSEIDTILLKAPANYF